MFAAQVWTYWFAPLLLATAVAMVIATGVGYYRKVAVPQFMLEQQRLLDQYRRLEERRRLERPRRLQQTTAADGSGQASMQLPQRGDQVPAAA